MRNVEVLGLVANVIGPVSASYVPLPKGLTVLYGLNGAGKTRLLQAINAALGGGSPTDHDGRLVVRAAIGDEPSDNPQFVQDYAASWADQDQLEWTPSGVPPELAVHIFEPLTRAVDSSLQNEREFLVSDASGPAIDLAQLTAEFVQQQLFLIEPSGWDAHEVQLAGLATDDSPLIDAFISKLRTAKQHNDATLRYGFFEDPFNGDRPFDSNRLPLVSLWDSGKWIRGLKVATVLGDPAAGTNPNIRDVLSQVGGPLGFTLLKDGRLSTEAERFLRALEGRTQELLDQVLLDAPTLELYIGEPSDWLLGQAPTWRASISGSGEIPVNSLSRAQERWALTAISIATHLAIEEVRKQQKYAREGGPLVIILDEPEAALHRSAEAYMARGLMTWANTLDAQIVVASHSPELLDLTEANLLFVGPTLTGKHNEVRPLDGPTRDTMKQLGLAPSDLLRRHRGFLLVEGTHDQVVLEALIGEELKDARVQILLLRGAKNLHTILDSQFLFDYTDARVIVMLDAIDADHVARVWAEAIELSATRGPADAGERLREQLPGNAPENKWMREFLSKSLQTGLENRLKPFGLEHLDIIDYLPVEKLVKRATSWPELRAEHAKRGNGKPFKAWLSETRGTIFSESRIRSAVEALDNVPDEFVTLINLCRSL